MPHPLLVNKKILIVEDDDACRYLLQIILEGFGCSFELSSNGQAAVDHVKTGAFDLVLMDLRMPIMNGYEATEAIRMINKDIPVIALTAHALAWDEGKCQACGMNDFLIKPFRQEQLIAVLCKWTGGAIQAGSSFA